MSKCKGGNCVHEFKKVEQTAGQKWAGENRDKHAADEGPCPFAPVETRGCPGDVSTCNDCKAVAAAAIDAYLAEQVEEPEPPKQSAFMKAYEKNVSELMPFNPAACGRDEQVLKMWIDALEAVREAIRGCPIVHKDGWWSEDCIIGELDALKAESEQAGE